MRIPPRYDEPVITPRARRSVEAAWTFAAKEDGRATVLPDGRCDLIIRFNALRDDPAVPILTGPATRPYVVEYTCGDTWVGVRLRPGCISPLINQKDAVVRGASVHSIAPDLAAIGRSEMGVAAIQAALFGLRIVTQAAPCPPRVQAVLDQIHLTCGRSRSDTLAQDLSITPRHLSRLFRRHVGLSPKTYGQLIRFHRSVTLLRSGQLTLSQIAMEAGYADQAHMTRDVVRFGGFAPSAVPADVSQPGFFA